MTAACILVLGGYGGFGGRIAIRLASIGHEVLVAGRNLDKANRFCAGRARLQPCRIDRDDDLETVLLQLRPGVLVDASGPFQGASYTVARACIATRVHYVDLADARDFVVGIGTLDADARAAGVTVLSGASSVPALSGAAVRAMVNGMDSIRAVEIAISVSNRATAGRSVAAAILDYVGRPIPLWRGGRWTLGYGWQEMRRMSFAVEGLRPISGRWVALAEVPDLDLLPDRLPGKPAVTFRAGTDLGGQMWALWILSWFVRWQCIGHLRRLAGALRPLQRLMDGLASDRSAMAVRIFGTSGSRSIERRWTLLAEGGDGPEIPSLTAPIVVRQILAGRSSAGARDAGCELQLSDYEESLANLAVKHAVRDIEQSPPLYARVMGSRFDALPPSLQSLHAPLRDAHAVGRATVTVGQSRLARMVARLAGFPSAGEHQVHVHFRERSGVETWARTFSGRSFRSHLSNRGGCLIERFGLLRFAFDLPSDDRGLEMIMRAWWIVHLRLPLILAPRTHAREWEEDSLFRFDVRIALPLIGDIVHYQGWLKTE